MTSLRSIVHGPRFFILFGRSAVPVALFALLTVVATFICPESYAEPGLKPRDIPKKLEARGKNLTALKAVMSLSSSFDFGKSRQDVRGFFLYRRPTDFRFQGIAPGGNSLFELVIKSNRFEMYVPSDGKLIKGKKPCFYKKYPDVAELESLIPLALLQWRTVRVLDAKSEGSRGMVVTFRFKGNLWKATLERDKLLLRRLEKIVSDKVQLTADFGSFADGKYGWLPRRFDVRCPSAGWRTVVKISKLKVNPFLLEKNFKLDPTFTPKVEICK
jgi:outer membrane lipoprotein-sorting protein